MMILPRLVMMDIWLTALAGEVSNPGPRSSDMTFGMARNATLAFTSTVAYSKA